MMLIDESGAFESFFNMIPFGIYVMDIDSYRIVFMNKVLISIRGDLAGQICHKALYEADTPCISCQIDYLLTPDRLPNGLTHVHEHFNDAEDRWYQMQEKAMRWPDGRIVKCAIAVDITELKAVQNQLAEAHATLALKNRDLERLTITDQLTGLYNRLKLDAAFGEEIARVGRYKRPFSIIMMDLDLFKSVNDAHGHLAGDMVLKEVSSVLRSHIRKVDMAGRWGGEEFLVICPETDLEGAVILAEHIRSRIDAHRFPAVGRITASFGVASHRPGESATDIVRRADGALYQAKTDGRNRVYIAA